MKRAFRSMTKDKLHSLYRLGRHGAAFLDGSTDVVLGGDYFRGDPKSGIDERDRARASVSHLA